MSEPNLENLTSRETLTREHGKTPMILDFAVSNEETVITQIIFKKFTAYFTDARIIIYNTSKTSSNNIAINSIPYKKITNWNICYKSLNDSTPYLGLSFGATVQFFKFTDINDVLTLHKVLVHYCCK